jgi:hypothetical protein
MRRPILSSLKSPPIPLKRGIHKGAAALLWGEPIAFDACQRGWAGAQRAFGVGEPTRPGFPFWETGKGDSSPPTQTAKQLLCRLGVLCRGPGFHSHLFCASFVGRRA